jgi:phosphatidylserine/phosphatidylglycerophosphate/cardiolipin synthase-like enzyme/uncharacterized membrane protein YdjX (TVP38/TMEM64 family)
LQAYILLWDWSPIYALEREPLFFGDGPWEAHDRLHLLKDSAHPLGASHHQKIVVIDGAIAWCGGFDISRWRWDTSAHAADEPRRKEPGGDHYPPFHDLQLLVDDEAASALEEVALDRWRWAGGEPLTPISGASANSAGNASGAGAADVWPDGLAPWLGQKQVLIARTFPEYDERPAARESEQLYLDMIGAARHLIYIENQYLTSRAVRDALKHALSQDEPPWVLIVLPEDTGKWLEQYTMDALRVRALAELREADSKGRLGVYFPDVPGLDEGCMMVHAKLMIVDDKSLRIGSSNLSNRSFGLDSECDLAIVAEDQDTARAICNLRRRLLAMFMSVTPEQVAAAEEAAAERGEGLTDAIEALRAEQNTESNRRMNRLQPVCGDSEPQWEDQMPNEHLVDPDGPLSADQFVHAVAAPEHHPHVRRWLLVGLGMIAFFVLLAIAWHLTPLGDAVDPDPVIAAARNVANSLWGPALALAGFVVATVNAVPVTLVVFAAMLVFGPVMGALIAAVGATFAAISGYEIGRLLGRTQIEQLVGGPLDRVKRRLSRRGALAIVAVRIAPVASFSVLNLVAGATGWRRRDFLIGSLLGMLPAITLLALIANWLTGYMERDDLRAIALVVGIGVILIGGADLAIRVARQRFRTTEGSRAIRQSRT